MGRLFVLLALVYLALLVVALIDCLSCEDFEIRGLPKAAWVLIILLFSPLGAIVWFVAGRPQREMPAPPGTWRAGNGFPERSRPRQLAPDDDPEFLRDLAARTRRDDEDLLRRWEADLRRREEELRRRTSKDETES
ncbi:PLD nuclease N-terminal domain-containing protein [Planosporangium sp. 12N6]|uniref:PLD nuclease N-terminal domain-containing protein n=1 Tax=Planosporangium spinosum TaxID=3402278 RepID=UPI003CF0265F